MAALKYFQSNGWQGTFSEGHLLRSIFRALILPVTIDLQPFREFDPSCPYSHAIHYLVQMVVGGDKTAFRNPVNNHSPQHTLKLLHESIENRLDGDASELQRDFDDIASAIATLHNPSPAPGTDIQYFLPAIPRSFWHDLLDLYASGNHDLHHGWPDLEIGNAHRTQLVEIKTTDNLSGFQRAAIKQLEGLGMTCIVLRVIRT
ncbi:hypothetical protein ACMSSJ_11195 [Kerstersia gyiorum]|uniref:hypothetical protein n=1 Tax=Kerstersia gyiorum TaxID=206506 RepID=UPI0039EA65D5